MFNNNNFPKKIQIEEQFKMEREKNFKIEEKNSELERKVESINSNKNVEDKIKREVAKQTQMMADNHVKVVKEMQLAYEEQQYIARANSAAHIKEVEHEALVYLEVKLKSVKTSLAHANSEIDKYLERHVEEIKIRDATLKKTTGLLNEELAMIINEVKDIEEMTKTKFLFKRRTVTRRENITLVCDRFALITAFM